MTTVADTRKLAKSLLNQNPDLVIIGRLVFYKQVGHLLRGIHIDRCRNKLRFCPKWIIDYLFRPMENYSIGIGEDIYSNQGEQWLIDNDNIGIKFANRMEDIALPKLQEFQTIEEFSKIKYNMSSFDTFTLAHTPIRKLYVDLALGKFEAAGKALELFSNQRANEPKHVEPSEHFTELMDVVRPLVHAQDKAAIAALLHKWEAYSVKQLKLEKYWQKTPFPIEVDLS